jgi:hypothetical protein
VALLFDVLPEGLSQLQLGIIFAHLIDCEQEVIFNISKHDTSALEAKELGQMHSNILDEVTLRPLGANLPSEFNGLQDLLLHLILLFFANDLLQFQPDYTRDYTDYFLLDLAEALVHFLF